MATCPVEVVYRGISQKTSPTGHPMSTSGVGPQEHAQSNSEGGSYGQQGTSDHGVGSGGGAGQGGAGHRQWLCPGGGGGGGTAPRPPPPNPAFRPRERP